MFRIKDFLAPKRGFPSRLALRDSKAKVHDPEFSGLAYRFATESALKASPRMRRLLYNRRGKVYAMQSGNNVGASMGFVARIGIVTYRASMR